MTIMQVEIKLILIRTKVRPILAHLRNPGLLRIQLATKQCHRTIILVEAELLVRGRHSIQDRQTILDSHPMVSLETTMPASEPEA